MLDSVPGMAGHLLSGCCNSHLMDPVKHEVTYFPFPIGSQAALTQLGCLEVSWLLYANLASGSFRLHTLVFHLPHFTTSLFFFFLRKKKNPC